MRCSLSRSALTATVASPTTWASGHAPPRQRWLRSKTSLSHLWPSSRSDMARATLGQRSIEVHGALGDLVEVTRSSPTAPIELLALGVSKASGVAFVADQLGITPPEILAIGDMPNDLPMLHWAGRSAAPANAHENVLTTVDTILGDCDEDGVAELIEQLAVVAGR